MGVELLFNIPFLMEKPFSIERELSQFLETMGQCACPIVPHLENY